MKLSRCIVSLVLVACGSPAPAAAPAPLIHALADLPPDDAGAPPTPCAVPATRDRAGLVAALATGCAQLEATEYTVATPQGAAAKRRPYAMLSMGTGELRGVPGSLITFVGDAQRQDWWGIELTGGSIHDVEFGTAGLTGTSEQTHVFHSAGLAGNIEIYNVTINHPRVPGMRRGDCMQFVGYAAVAATATKPAVPDRLVTGVKLHNMTLNCARSCVAAHSGVHGLEFANNSCTAGDQGVDGEGTGGSADWVIANNTFMLSAVPQGDYAIQLDGVDRAHVTGNRFWGQGVDLLNASHVEIDNNVIIRTTAAAGVGAVQIDKASNAISIHDNTIVRTAEAGPGRVIWMMPRDGVSPTDITIRRNMLTQATAGNVIHATGVVGLHVEDNTTLYSGPPGWYGVLVEGQALAAADQTTITGDTWLGPLKACVGLDGAKGVNGALLSGGHAYGPLSGLTCSNAGVLGPVTVQGSYWPASTCGIPNLLVSVP